jgi:hypothetical protein
MTERETLGVELLLNEPEIRAWLAPERVEDDADEESDEQ